VVTNAQPEPAPLGSSQEAEVIAKSHRLVASMSVKPYQREGKCSSVLISNGRILNVWTVSPLDFTTLNGWSPIDRGIYCVFHYVELDGKAPPVEFFVNLTEEDYDYISQAMFWHMK
jgi:hypothetical protein